MTMNVRRQKLIDAIQELDNTINSLKYSEYDGQKSFQDREHQVFLLKQHRREALRTLLELTEQELKSA